ncbi:hypothetical protein [Nonomuraea recticatena]|uniref:Uncharacterized protein n=1 Tax=Nonomuraea recticatena TaxID=46178 RepID=A0ABN3RPF4_9ACTN
MLNLIDSLPATLRGQLAANPYALLRAQAERLHERIPAGAVHEFIEFGLRGYGEATDAAAWKTEICREADRLLAADSDELEALLMA